MRHNHLIAAAVFQLLVLSPTNLFAETAKQKSSKSSTDGASKKAEKLTAQSWVKRLRDENKLKSAATGLFPARILFVEDLPAKGQPVFANIDVEDFDKIGFLKAASKKELDYFFALNKKPKNLREKSNPVAQTPDSWLSVLLEASEADSVLWMHKKGDWQLYQNRDGKPEILISRPPRSGRDAEDVHKWLLDGLGYEGVIIDKQDNFLLVGNLANITKSDTQALLLKNSADKFTMANAKKEGGGLLQLANHFEGFAMFELLLGDRPESIPIGTKIAIEKSENKTKGAAKKLKKSDIKAKTEDTTAKPAKEPERKDATPEADETEE